MSAGFVALLDSVIGILDDVSALTKKAAAKTVGVAGDDLAVSATQLAHVKAERELAVVARIAAFSAVNKAILIPLAVLVSAVSPLILSIILVIGGLYLCIEGGEKVVSLIFAGRHAPASSHNVAVEGGGGGGEKSLIRGAVKTDFVLSAEIIVIAMGEVSTFGLGHQFATLLIVGAVMTVGVYGIVALIVKADDVGLWMMSQPASIVRRVGSIIVNSMPGVMRLIAVVGTAAMFSVGGGILVHKMDWLEISGLSDYGFLSPLYSASVGLGVGVLLASIWHGLRIGPKR